MIDVAEVDTETTNYISQQLVNRLFKLALLDIQSDSFRPLVNDGATLGTSALQWSDLFLASGGVINWDSGNFIITHSTGLLTFNNKIKLENGIQVYGSNQTGTTYTTGVPTGSTLELMDSGVGVGSGGALVFGAGANAWRFATIKGFAQNGTNNSVGSLAFYTRRITTDSTLTPAMWVNYNGNIGIGTTNPWCPLDVRTPFAKTDTSLRFLSWVGSNEDISNNPFGLYTGFTGATTRANRTITLQTSSWGDLDDGILSLQPSGGSLLLGPTRICGKSEVTYSQAIASPLFSFRNLSSAIGTYIEFIDAAATPNNWWMGTGAGSPTDGHFTIYDARQTAVRFRIGTDGSVTLGVTSGIGTGALYSGMFSAFQSADGASALGAGWIAGVFGSNISGDKVVIGSGSSHAIIGAHNNALNAWADIYINPYTCTGIGVSETNTLTALLNLAASTTAKASINIPHGTAPTSPVDGDIWTTTSGTFVQINGVTKTVTLT